MQRRGFLGSILALGAAPAIAKAGVLMPVKKLWVPPNEGIRLYRQDAFVEPKEWLKRSGDWMHANIYSGHTYQSIVIVDEINNVEHTFTTWIPQL